MALKLRDSIIGIRLAACRAYRRVSRGQERAGRVMSSATMLVCERSALVSYQGVSVNHIEVLPEEWGGAGSGQTLHRVQRDHANV